MPSYRIRNGQKNVTVTAVREDRLDAVVMKRHGVEIRRGTPVAINSVYVRKDDGSWHQIETNGSMYPRNKIDVPTDVRKAYIKIGSLA